MRSWLSFIVLGFLYGLQIPSLHAQTPYFLKYTTDDGLSSNIIYDVFQDREGFLWIATDKGVCRYDGYKFRAYNLNDGLADNEVIRIDQDQQGRIWFLTLIGKLSFFYNDSFYNKSNCSYLAQIPDAKGYLNYFAEDDKNIYFGSSGNELLRLGRDSSFSKVSNQLGGISSIWNYREKVYFIGPDSIRQIVGDSWGLSEKSQLPQKAVNNRTRVFSFDTKLFLCTGNRVICYNQASKELLMDYQFPTSEMDITSFFFDSKQKLWVGTRKGVFLAQNLETAKAGEWHNFLENMLVTCMYEDNEKNIWIGSMGKALFFIPHSDISWIHQPYLEAASQITTSLYADEQKRIWSGHDNSSFIIHTKSGEIKHSLGKPSNLERISKIKKVNDAIWIIGKSKTRVIRNADTMDLPYYGNDLILDGHENYWLASTYIYVIPKKKIDRQLSSKGTIEKNGLSGDSILLRKRGNVLYEDPQGGIWIGLFEGLYYFKDGTIENLSERHPNLRGKINDISCLPDSQNILVATDNFGLVELNIQSKRPNETSRFRQLGSLSCYAITIHNQDCWLGTNKGIIYIDLSEQSKAIGYSDLLGLKNLHVLDIVVVDDKLYAASSNGLLEFNQILPKQIYKQAPPIFLTGIFQKDKRLPNLHDVVLSYWENELTLRFKGISFRERGNLSYKYQLIGLDQNFQYTNNQEVVLKALPPGKYDLILFAINKAGIESKVPAEFSFSIQKPYWQEWWFVLLIVLSAIAIAALTWRLRLSIVRREYELENARLAEEKRSLKLENELSEVEQHALRLQMNPHFIFNALNSIKGYYAEKKVAEADEYLSRFAKILRHILENTHRYSSLEEELEILHLYIEMAQMRHPGMLEYTIEVEPGLNASDFSLPALLLQPFVENAIMHGIAPKSGGGHIQIKCSLNEGNLICVIKDNGIGLSNSKLKRKESEHQSKAIEISKKRLEYITRQEGVLCRLEINDDIENGAIIGTVVTITIPANKLW